jgi:hypothetical protein
VKLLLARSDVLPPPAGTTTAGVVVVEGGTNKPPPAAVGPMAMGTTDNGTGNAVMGMGPMPMQRSLLCGSVEYGGGMWALRMSGRWSELLGETGATDRESTDNSV